jgi:hypothetical protein
VLDLTPEEILMYWSLLSPSQKEAFIAEKLAQGGLLELEGIKLPRGSRWTTQDTVFDRFAGIYHAFERLRNHVEECLEREEWREASARLFGAKYDSLPELLRKTEEKSDDPVTRYIIFLCGLQIANRVKKSHPDFWTDNKIERRELERELSKIEAMEESLPLESTDEEFIAWYRQMFLKVIDQPVDVT